MKNKYEKPRIIHTEPIEGIAGACGGATKADESTCVGTTIVVS